MDFKRNLWILVSVCFAGYVGVALPYPVLAPLFLQSDAFANLSFSPVTLMAWVLAAYPLGLFFGSQKLGQWSDRYDRSIVLKWSLLWAIVGNMLSAWAIFIDHYWLLLIARFFTGFCEGNIAVARAILLDIADNTEQRSKGFGWFNAAAYAGYLFGPLLGGVLATAHFVTPFIIAACFCLIAYGFVFGLRLSTNKVAKKSPTKGHFWQVPLLKSFIFCLFLVTFATNVFYEFYPAILVIELASTPAEISYFTAVLTLFMICCSVVVFDKLYRRFSPYRIFVASATSIGALLIAFIFASGSMEYLIIFAILGLAIAIFNGVYTTWFSEFFSQLEQGRLMGVLVSTFCLANVSAAIFGSLFDKETIKQFVLLGAISAILSAYLMLWLNSKNNGITTAKESGLDS